jgi:hypothetical protein
VEKADEFKNSFSPAPGIENIKEFIENENYFLKYGNDQ